MWDTTADPRGQALQKVSWSDAEIVDIVALPGGGRVATIDKKGRVAVGSPPDAGRVIGPHPQAAAITATPDGAGFVTAGEDGTARRWSVDGGAPTVIMRGATPLQSVASGAGGIVVVSDENGVLSAWRAGHRLDTSQLFRGLVNIWLSAGPGGGWISAANGDGFVVWRVAAAGSCRCFADRQPRA